MATTVQPQSSRQEGRLRVFCPNARHLTSEELSGLSREERMRAEAGDEGVWLEVPCPEEKCLIGDSKMALHVRGVKREMEEEGLWHKLFCPEDRCVPDSWTDIP